MNKHGLSRTIPAQVKREVRRSCGFGCVICGTSIIEYEHIDPPFAEAKEHDPDRIALLCPRCHAKVTRGFLSKEAVKEARRDPYCLKEGYASEFIDVGRKHPKIEFAGVTLVECDIPVQVDEAPLFQIKEAEEEGGPFRLSAHFSNSKGEASLQIQDNEWRVFTGNWDVEAVGGTITIRDAPGQISLQLSISGRGTIAIQNLNMQLNGMHFHGNTDDLVVESSDGRSMRLTNCIASNCHVGLAL
ncbi:HNH endonuclease [Salinibacter ruber]|uniref:HNH endonuclease n=1 Tax=Salinibacter ruber TaxID=146919 RepID=UPI002168FFB1|nr:HNH endonuclease signature motif containing protein [Salinibacter ruber]MCS4133673.1 hypothetical protein [Salinibacter ruber]